MGGADSPIPGGMEGEEGDPKRCTPGVPGPWGGGVTKHPGQGRPRAGRRGEGELVGPGQRLERGQGERAGEERTGEGAGEGR